MQGRTARASTQNAACIRFNNHAICLPFILRGRTNQCILTYIPNGADARAVRPYMPLAPKSFFDIANLKVQCSKFNVQSQSPYMPVMALLMQKMVGGTD